MSNYDEWEYNSEVSDWQNVMTGEHFSNYDSPASLQAILDNNINTTLA